MDDNILLIYGSYMLHSDYQVEESDIDPWYL